MPWHPSHSGLLLTAGGWTPAPSSTGPRHHGMQHPEQPAESAPAPLVGPKCPASLSSITSQHQSHLLSSLSSLPLTLGGTTPPGRPPRVHPWRPRRRPKSSLRAPGHATLNVLLQARGASLPISHSFHTQHNLAGGAHLQCPLPASGLPLRPLTPAALHAIRDSGVW